MAFGKLFVALAGVCVLPGCGSEETVGRSDTSDFHYSMSAMIDERDLHQSLAAVSMKDQLAKQPPAQGLIYTDAVMGIIANYRH